MGSANRDAVEAAGFVVQVGGRASGGHLRPLLGPAVTWGRGGEAWTCPAASFSSQPLNHDTSEQTR